MTQELRSKVKRRKRPEGVAQYKTGWHRYEMNIPTIKTKVRLRLVDASEIEPLEPLEEKDRKKVEELKRLILSGVNLTPVGVHGRVMPGDKYQIYDGHHRFLAYSELGMKIPVEVTHNISDKWDRFRRMELSYLEPWRNKVVR